MKDDNVMIGRKNFFRSPIKNDLITYDNIRKIGTGQGQVNNKHLVLIQKQCNKS